MSSKRALAVLLAVTALLSAAVAVRVPLTFPITGYFPQAFEWAVRGRIADTFTPQAVPLFLGPALRLGGIPAILGLQALLQVTLAAVCYLILRELRLPPGWAAYGSLPVAINPEFLLSVSKIWDLTLSTFLFLLFVLCCLRIAHNGPLLSVKLTAAIGLVFAAAIFCRPNLIFLFPAIPMVMLHGRPNLSRATLYGHFAVFLVIVAAGFSLLGILSHGSPFFPRNGPYNLYAGHNPLSETALLVHLNAEFSLPPEFALTHPGHPVTDLYSPEMSSYFVHQSILVARQHPAEEVKLVVVKLYTLFRPDTKVHPLSSAQGLVMGVLALPVLLLLAAFLLPGRLPLSFEDRLLLTVELLYIVPFLITNSDPRFRITLDGLLLLHLVSLIYRRRSARPALASA
jgi:hypothetical protein